MFTSLALVPLLLAVPVQDEGAADRVAAFLAEAEAQLYQPEAHGLTSISFDMPVPGPAGPLATVKVSWQSGRETQCEVEVGEALYEMMPEEQADAMAEQFASPGKEAVTTMLNRPFTQMLENGSATLEGVEDGMMAVKFVEADGQETVFLFDEENRARKGRTPVPEMQTTAEIELSWRPASDDTDLLIRDSLKANIEMPGMGKVSSTTRYSYATVDGIVVLTGMTQSQMGQTIEIPFDNLVVNGKPLAGEPEDAAEG